MKPESQENWLTVLEGQIENRKKTIEATRQARNSADSPMTSRYDTQRDIFNNDLNINLDGLEADEKFMEEVRSSGERSIVESGAVVTIDYGEDDQEKVLFMNNYGRLPGLQVVTPKSSLGQAIDGLHPDENTSYEINSSKFQVKIVAVE